MEHRPNRSRPWPALPGPRSAGGFSLIELVLVMVLLGILAAVAVPRFQGQLAWATRGYFDAARSALDFARQTAIAQRRWVCVDVGDHALGFTRSSLPKEDDTLAACIGTQPLVLPGGDNNALVADSAITVALAGGAASPLIFNSLGQLVNAAGTVLGTVQLTVTGDQTYTLSIEGPTGYVH